MTDKQGPRVAWLCAVLASIATILIALGAARAVHAQTGTAASGAAQTSPADAKSSGGQSGLTPGDHALELGVGGQKRTYVLHVPKGYTASSTKPLPVVVMLHGAGGSGKQVEAQTGWDKKADKETFLALFPNALPARPNARPAPGNPRFWRDGSHRGEAVGGQASASVDDVAFITALLDDTAKRFPVDEKRIFVTGFSSGASMTFRLLVSPLAARIAAGAPVSGHLWVTNAAPAHAVPALLIWGSADPLNPILGSGNNNRGLLAKPSLQAEAQAYSKVIGAPATPAPISDNKGVKRVAYGPGKNGAELVVVTVEGAGHVWPGSAVVSPLSEKVVGPSTNKLNATDAIWEFFQRHYLAPRSTTP